MAGLRTITEQYPEDASRGSAVSPPTDREDATTLASAETRADARAGAGVYVWFWMLLIALVGAVGLLGSLGLWLGRLLHLVLSLAPAGVALAA